MEPHQGPRPLPYWTVSYKTIHLASVRISCKHTRNSQYEKIFRWYASLGMYDVAVANMLNVLACSEQSKATQELFLRDFLHTVQVWTTS